MRSSICVLNEHEICQCLSLPQNTPRFKPKLKTSQNSGLTKDMPKSKPRLKTHQSSSPAKAHQGSNQVKAQVKFFIRRIRGMTRDCTTFLELINFQFDC